jgi:hypothetical protein
MDFIGHSTIRRAAPEAKPPEPETATVRIWGEAKDAVQVDGPLEGCKPYETTCLWLHLHGPESDVRLRVEFDRALGKWLVTVRHGDSRRLLPVLLDGSQGDSSPMATVEGVSQVIHN